MEELEAPALSFTSRSCERGPSAAPCVVSVRPHSRSARKRRSVRPACSSLHWNITLLRRSARRLHSRRSCGTWTLRASKLRSAPTACCRLVRRGLEMLHTCMLIADLARGTQVSYSGQQGKSTPLHGECAAQLMLQEMKEKDVKRTQDSRSAEVCHQCSFWPVLSQQRWNQSRTTENMICSSTNPDKTSIAALPISIM